MPTNNTSNRFYSSASVAIICLTGAAIIDAGNTDASAPSGYTMTTMKAAHRDVPLPLHIWYPAEEGEIATIGNNAVFKGTKVRTNAAAPKDALPLIVLSHGSGGNAANLGWIAGHLASQGNIVVATNHPNTTSGNSLAHETVKIWERPQDVSAILDHFEKNTPFGLKADMSKAGVVGFSLGGYTAMAVAGARASQADYIDYCNTHAGLMDCKWFSDAGVDLSKTDTAKYEQDLRDARISFAVAIDPALSQAYQRQTLAAMDLPVQIINLGGGKLPAAIDASGYANALPMGDYQTIDQANHFSFLGECTMMGEAIIKSVGEDPICSDTGKRSRASVHKELKAMIAKFVRKATKGAASN